ATELVEPIQETKNSDDMGAYDAFVATQQAGGSEQSTASNKFWPLAGVTATLLFGVVILYRRKKKNRIDEPEIDASPLKSFILEDEQNEEKSDNSVDSIPSSYSDDIFKPVRRQHEDSREKEVAYTVQEG
ncbi:MAG: LPXTG cell wall anchor domain-containing protein, partial [bacterium]